MGERRNKRYNHGDYIDGSAVRKVYSLPEYERERVPRERVKEAPRRKSKAKKKPAINFATFMVLSIAIGITIYASVDYLKVQSDMMVLNKSIATLQDDYVALQSDNNARLSEIDSSLDLKKVFNTAVKDLGMVFPNKNEVITYEAAVSEYVRQYATIPETSAKELLEKFRK